MTDQLKSMLESIKKLQEERRALFSIKIWSTAQERRWHEMETNLRVLKKLIKFKKP